MSEVKKKITVTYNSVRYIAISYYNVFYTETNKHVL